MSESVSNRSLKKAPVYDIHTYPAPKRIPVARHSMYIPGALYHFIKHISYARASMVCILLYQLLLLCPWCLSLLSSIEADASSVSWSEEVWLGSCNSECVIVSSKMIFSVFWAELAVCSLPFMQDITGMIREHATPISPKRIYPACQPYST